MIQHVRSHKIQEPGTRVMGLFPLMYAIHAWLRQVQLHAAYYKWFIDLKKRSGSLASEKTLTHLMEEGGSIGAANPTLSLSLDRDLSVGPARFVCEFRPGSDGIEKQAEIERKAEGSGQHPGRN